ncbi:MAG: hypothetical protein IJD60_07445 [Clostridia bacterium]|nr:hypothetical protein [Clostridia bacterium]
MFKWMKKACEGLRFATYPACDHLNISLRFLMEDAENNRRAIEEICFAIIKAGGYYYKDVANCLVFYGFGDFVKEEMVHATD